MIESLGLPVSLDLADGTGTLRIATEQDTDVIVRLLEDDAVSASRGDAADPASDAFAHAVREILATAFNALLVVVDSDDEIVGTMQLTRIPGLARGGTARLLVEAVRVRSDRRSSRIGTAMMRWVTDVAAVRIAATLVQLTSDASRADAHRFYERLGFVQSHLGFKYRIE